MFDNVETCGYPLPWRNEGQFVIAADGRSVTKVNGMSNVAEFIAKAINSYNESHPRETAQ